MHDTPIACIQVDRRQLQVNFKIISPQGDMKYSLKFCPMFASFIKKKQSSNNTSNIESWCWKKDCCKDCSLWWASRTSPILTQRLKFACDYLKHGDELWKSDFWSDETKMPLFGNMDVAFLRWRKRERLSNLKTPFPQLNMKVGA